MVKTRALPETRLVSASRFLLPSDSTTQQYISSSRLVDSGSQYLLPRASGHSNNRSSSVMKESNALPGLSVRGRGLVGSNSRQNTRCRELSVRIQREGWVSPAVKFRSAG